MDNECNETLYNGSYSSTITKKQYLYDGIIKQFKDSNNKSEKMSCLNSAICLFNKKVLEFITAELKIVGEKGDSKNW